MELTETNKTELDEKVEETAEESIEAETTESESTEASEGESESEKSSDDEKPAYSYYRRKKKEDPVKLEFTAGMLKIFACIIMLIDHIGAAVIYYGFHFDDKANPPADKIRTLYVFMRLTGRLAFPIFCFLIVEGYKHTRNVWKYLRNLLIFGLISEVPFDLAFNAKFFYLKSQNVYFTLALGLLMVIAFDKMTQGNFLKAGLKRQAAAIVLAAIPVALGFLLQTDYGGLGVLLIFTFYLFGKNEMLGVVTNVATLTFINPTELLSCFDFYLIKKYNGQKGISLKYFFYLYYPVHLLILVVIRYLVFHI
ncbi:MAG: conjugal transfer protein TraX [Eubacterium sp.]|nr:conjugal transfer protein TraX [Eubacterium sp.]